MKNYTSEQKTGKKVITELLESLDLQFIRVFSVRRKHKHQIEDKIQDNNRALTDSRQMLDEIKRDKSCISTNLIQLHNN